MDITWITGLVTENRDLQNEVIALETQLYS